MNPLWRVILLTALAGCILLKDYNVQALGERPQDSRPSAIPQAIDFGQFVEKYHKLYSPIETVAKCKIFLGRTLEIFKHNVQFVNKKVKYFLKQSEYIDMTSEELRQTFVIRDIDFEPVKEASQWPDKPADEIIEMQLNGRHDSEAPIKSDLDDHKKNLGNNLPKINLIEEYNLAVDEELSKVDGNTDKIASELITSSKVGVNEGLITEEAQKVKNIKVVSFVEPNNRNFDPTGAMRSYGIMDTVETFAENFAKSMMNDFSSDLDLNESLDTNKDYPAPSFLESLKSISNYFSRDEDAKRMEIEGDNSAYEEDEKPTFERSPNRLTRIDATNYQLDPEMIGKPVYMIDWRKTGCISAPKSQGNCKSCYVFATLDLMEFFYCRQKGEKVEFSVQYVLDCGSKFNINGCSDGKIANVGRFIIERGINLEAYMPYLAKENQCPYTEQEFASGSPYPIKPKLTHWRMFSELADWYKWLPWSPLVVGINMPADFLAYGGGLHDGSNCLPEMVHAMLLVGSGVQDGKKFWLLKNTFSQTWGESGYFKLAQGAPINCFNSAVVVRAQFDVVVVPADKKV